MCNEELIYKPQNNNLRSAVGNKQQSKNQYKKWQNIYDLYIKIQTQMNIHSTATNKCKIIFISGSMDGWDKASRKLTVQGITVSQQQSNKFHMLPLHEFEYDDEHQVKNVQSSVINFNHK